MLAPRFWEAFVSGASKGHRHDRDAQLAVDAFQSAIPNIDAANKIHELSVFSLIGAAIIRSGWLQDAQLLSVPCVVIGT